MSANIDLATCSETDLWRYVASHLESRDIGVVLVGGAVVAVYTEGAYRSGDLDFVLDSLFEERLPAAMAEIGFVKEGRHFVHPECSHLFVEFVSGPLGIGRDGQIVPRREKVDDSILKILSPTDCVCDRLASYIHFRARECLDQAVLVAQAQTVDWKRIETWCRGEGAPEAYEDLRRLVHSSR